MVKGLTIEVSEALPKMGQKAEDRDLTLRKRGGGQFPSHYGESFGGIDVRLTRIFTVSEFFCASQGGQGGRQRANPPQCERGRLLQFPSMVSLLGGSEHQ